MPFNVQIVPSVSQVPSGAEVLMESHDASTSQTITPREPPAQLSSVESQPFRPTSNARRKFNESLDLALLKEVQAANAHRPQHGTTLVGFAEVAIKFNNSNLVAWKTDGKHCQDRFKLLIAKFTREDKERASRSGGGEEYGEFEKLCQDLVTEMDDFKAEKNAVRNEAQEKEDALLAAGRTVRDIAMSRSSSRPDTEGTEDEDAADLNETPRRKRKTSPAKTQQEMDRAILAVEKAEEQRIEMSVRQDARDQERLNLDRGSAERDEKRLALEDHRIETEAVAVEDRNNIERRRVDLEERKLVAEERRMAIEDKRAEEAAAERRLGMEVQKSMLELIRELRKKD